MNKKQRQYRRAVANGEVYTPKRKPDRRAVANGEVYTPKRKPAMPSPKIIELKTRYKRVKRVDPDNEE